MSFFTNFPKLAYDVRQNGSLTNVYDIFRYVDVIEKVTNNPMAYQYEYIRDGERPDSLSLRLYGNVDYYWTFFIANDYLKDGLEAWPKGQYELQQYISNAFTDYAVLSVPPQAENNLVGLKDDSENDIVLNELDAYVFDRVTGYGYAVTYYDSIRAQLFLNTSVVKKYHFEINNNIGLYIHYPLDTDVFANDATEASDQASDDPDYTLKYTAHMPTWDENVGAYYFNGIDQYLDLGTIGSKSGYDISFLPNYADSENIALHDDENWTISFFYKGDMGSGLSSESEGENGTISGSIESYSVLRSAGFGIVDGCFAYWIKVTDNDSDTYSIPHRIIIQSTTKINDNIWHHCVLTHDADTKITKMFVDGVLQGQSNLEQDIGDFGVQTWHLILNYLMVGDIPIDSDSSTIDEPGSGQSYTRGYLKDFRVYNQTKDSLTVLNTIQDAESDEDTTNSILSWDTTENASQSFKLLYGHDASDAEANYSSTNFDAYYYWADASLAPDYYTNDSDETITTYDALDSESDLRTQQFVSYKEALENLNEERRTITVVKPAYVQSFIEEYKRLMNL